MKTFKLKSKVTPQMRAMLAAPKVLMALEELLAMCERQTDFNDDGDGCMFERARAAIAEATGGAA